MSHADMDSGPLRPPPLFDPDARERSLMHQQILSSVTHDLKTPLVPIIGSLEIVERLQDKLPNEKKLDLIKMALNEAYRLDAFISNILDIAKLENGLTKAKPEPIDITMTLQNCLMRMAPKLQGSDVYNEKSGQEPLTAVTDAILLTRVLCMVLDNAVKYSGTPSVIHINHGKESDYYGFIRIWDNGKGLPDGEEDIFAKYVRSTKGDQNTGTGLGLAISRGIMRLLGGEVSAENHPSGGAVFTLQFPLSGYVVGRI